MALVYTDASALVKLLREEPESAPLRAFLSDADLLCSELASCSTRSRCCRSIATC